MSSRCFGARSLALQEQEWTLLVQINPHPNLLTPQQKQNVSNPQNNVNLAIANDSLFNYSTFLSSVQFFLLVVFSLSFFFISLSFFSFCCSFLSVIIFPLSVCCSFLSVSLSVVLLFLSVRHSFPSFCLSFFFLTVIIFLSIFLFLSFSLSLCLSSHCGVFVKLAEGCLCNTAPCFC